MQLLTKWYCLISIKLTFFRFLSTEVLADEADLDSGDLSSEYYDAPLQLSDIMPQNRKHYDKMRPPKYKGKL